MHDLGDLHVEMRRQGSRPLLKVHQPEAEQPIPRVLRFVSADLEHPMLCAPLVIDLAGPAPTAARSSSAQLSDSRPADRI